MAKKKRSAEKRTRRTFTRGFKQQAVQMMVDGYSASSVSDNLGIGNTNLLYRWKAELVSESGPVTETHDLCYRDLRAGFLFDRFFDLSLS
ncbi:transposase [Adhaeretor mobilis]|uniref:Transposase n=1 Tax=Adhaeretor mobilis TaxID=1930276 RepID=A0A517MSE3_9BACT|nr:transposase [Adhaeretor mobilis]QDS97796.1 Transposase [Adhaeretor mobilis]